VGIITPIQYHAVKMIRNIRPFVSKLSSSPHATTSLRALSTTPIRSLATPTMEGRSSPVRATSVEQLVDDVFDRLAMGKLTLRSFPGSII